MIQLNMHNFLTPAKNMDEMIELLEESVMYEVEKEYQEIGMPPMRNLMSRLLAVYAETKIPFVFIIDEWGCIFRVHHG